VGVSLSSQCARVQADAQMEAHPFFSRGINSGAASSAVQQEEEEQEVQEPLSVLAARFATAHAAHVRTQHAVDAEDVAPSSSSAAAAAAASPAGATDAGAPAAAMRHVQQNEALASALGAHALLDPSCTFVEVGAGKAMLSLSVSDALPPSSSTPPTSAPHRFLLVERDAPGGMHNKVPPSLAAPVECNPPTHPYTRTAGARPVRPVGAVLSRASPVELPPPRRLPRLRHARCAFGPTHPPTHSLTGRVLSGCDGTAGGPGIGHTRAGDAGALRRATRASEYYS